MVRPLDKAQWRKQLRARRAALTKEQRRQAEQSMLDRFSALPENERSGRVLVYVAVPPEAPTTALIERLWHEGHTVCLPRLSKERPGIMDVVPIGAWDELVPGPYFGIPQPADGVTTLPPEQLDVIVLPGVGFDHDGRRIGQAGGYYDRLLAGLSRRIVRIGWAFAVQFVQRLPEEPHDERVQLLVTELGVTRFDEREAPR